MSLTEKLDNLLKKYSDLEEKMMHPEKLGADFARVSKEYSDLEPIVKKIKEYKATEQSITDAEEMLKEQGIDPETKAMLTDEMEQAEKKLPELEKDLQVLLLPKDEADEKNAILEIRAGTGGLEAALFAGDLLRMYEKYAERKGWAFEIMSISEGEVGGVREAIVSIKGKNVFRDLKFESGTHRVQRVPETEAKGRVHTSAATVAVLPEVEDVDIKIDEKDLKIDVMRAGGPGGQCVNTTDSAVRITHLPTGLVVKQQDEKSQHKNREKAMKILRARLYELERERKDEERARERKEQIGTGDRSEKIRTYNYPQGRVTDHRIHLTLYKLDKIVEEGELDELINALIADDQAKRLAMGN